jgi:hypothetical protein
MALNVAYLVKSGVEIKQWIYEFDDVAWMMNSPLK